jgi:protein SCO1/2
MLTLKNSQRAVRRWCGGVAAVLLSAAVAAHQTPKVDADFVPPAPGTYRLERIMPAPDGNVVDTDHKQVRLKSYTEGKITLVSLMFTACSDEKGCPLAFFTIYQIKRELEQAHGANGQVQLVSLSFDPEHDTPEVMRAYGGEQMDGGSPVSWHFLTTASKADVAPILDGFGQDVSKPAGAESDREMVHVLKLFLVDKQGWVREIYTTSYLVPQVVVNDIKTLLLEDGVRIN